MPGAASQIPSFVLYGDADQENPAEFGHIETIAERSSLHDWEIAPHRHRHSLQVLIITQGNVDARLDGNAVGLAGPCHLVVPPGAVHGFRFAPGTRGWVLTLGQEFATRASGANDPLAALLSEGGVGALAGDAIRRIELLAGELVSVGTQWRGGGPFHALAEALLRSLPAVALRPDSVEDRRLAQFRHLVETHLAEHQPLGFYAASIGTTERTLARLVRRRLGIAPLEAINRRLVLEARRLLRHTNATVAQVAFELGFSDVSYFSRFYLRMTGCRPAAERRQD